MEHPRIPLPNLGLWDATHLILRGATQAARPVFLLSATEFFAHAQQTQQANAPIQTVFLADSHEHASAYHEMTRLYSSIFTHSTSVDSQLIGPIVPLEAGASMTQQTKARTQTIMSLTAFYTLHTLEHETSTDTSHIFHTTLADLEQIADAYTAMQASAQILETGSQLSPIGLTKILEQIGYEQEQQVIYPGTYNRKGGVIELFPLLNKFTVRIEFLGDSIENITEFDPKTKVVHEKKQDLLLLPFPVLSKIRRNADAPSNPLLNQIWKQQPVLFFDHEDVFEQCAPLIAAQATQPTPRAMVIFDNAPLLTTSSQHNQTFTSRHIETKEIHTQVNSTGKLHQTLEQAKKDGLSVIASGSEELYDHETRKHIDMMLPETDNAFTSFAYPDARLVYIAGHDVIGKKKTHGISGTAGGKNRQMTKREHRLFIAQLKINEFVVHVDHGIGKFIGMTTQQIDHVTREYFSIQYAGGDKIFVPVEYAEKIHRYIGTPNPTLHGLAQSNWHQLTRKVKEESQKIARELLKLYAQREAAQGFQFLPFPAQEEQLKESFHYDETPDQTRAISEILEDMERTRPMDRLLCGDVGFGKTEVAIRAAFCAVLNGKQVAVLCPTTILAQQHLDTFRTRLKGFGVRVEALSRFISGSQQRKTIKELADGAVDIIIGTHRILSRDVEFKDLGFVIIDEEQRFGVLHKEKLKAMRTSVDILTLTATPIPRTLNLALSGARDISTIETAPTGRLPIHTEVIQDNPDIVKREILRAMAEKDQIYFLYNRVETIRGYAQQLHELVPTARIGVAHGQMPEKDLSMAMEDFDNGKTDILLCTTIIENGLDLPNANTLIVHNAPLFGLSQLYQIRGRIGRSTKQARAFFFYSRKKLTGEAKERLITLKEANEIGSGLHIATRDLEIRGAGSILGKEQSGNVSDVGLQLYSELIQQSVQELESPLRAPTKLDTQVELPLESYIPQSVTNNEEKRYTLYQELSNLRTTEELREKRASYAADGNLPDQFRNFFDVLEIKLLAQQARILKIASIQVFGGGMNDPASTRLRLAIEFAETPAPQLLHQLLQQNAYWRINGTMLKIDMVQLGTGNSWIEKLKQTIALFIARPQ